MTIRPIQASDRAFVEKWLSEDEVHTQLGLTFENVMAPGSEVFIVEDNRGPLMCLRLQKAIRLGIQFDPKAPYRSAKAAPEVMAWLEKKAVDEGCTEMIIRPGGGAVNFAKRLGWMDFIGKFWKV